MSILQHGFFPAAERSDEREATENGIFIPVHRKLGSCMTHRPDIIWINSSADAGEILRLIREYPDFSYFPVCSGTVDSVLGVLSVRRFLLSLREKIWPGLKSLVYKPIYLPETVTIMKTLACLSQENCFMAFIIDEYGGIEGLVTRNGLVSELLDEFACDTEDSSSGIIQQDDHNWLVDGELRMEELREEFDLPAEAKDYHDYYTLAGYLLSLNGSIPKKGDRIPAGNYTCEIVAMDGHRIDKVLISRSDITSEPGCEDTKTAGEKN